MYPPLHRHTYADEDDGTLSMMTVAQEPDEESDVANSAHTPLEVAFSRTTNTAAAAGLPEPCVYPQPRRSARIAIRQAGGPPAQQQESSASKECASSLPKRPRTDGDATDADTYEAVRIIGERVLRGSVRYHILWAVSCAACGWAVVWWCV